MLDSLIHYDTELFLFLNNLGTNQWDGFWLFITNKLSAIPLYILILYFSYKYYGIKKTALAVLIIVLLIAVTDQTANLFKYGFKRLRPCHDEQISQMVRLVKESCGGLYSYFSAHAANSMAIALFFSLLFKNKNKIFTIILFAWALLAAYSRVYIGVHFPLDILTGIGVGVIYGFLFFKLFTLVSRKIMD